MLQFDGFHLEVKSGMVPFGKVPFRTVQLRSVPLGAAPPGKLSFRTDPVLCNVMYSIIYTRKIALKQLRYFICICTLLITFIKKNLTRIMASNTGRLLFFQRVAFSLIVFDQPIDVLLISL